MVAISRSEAARRAQALRREARVELLARQIVEELHLLRRENAALRDRDRRLTDEIVALRAMLANH